MSPESEAGSPGAGRSTGALGIDVGGTKLAGVVLFGGPGQWEVAAEGRSTVAQSLEGLQEGVAELAASLCEQAASQKGVETLWAGFGMPARVSRDGRLGRAANLRFITGLDGKQILGEALAKANVCQGAGSLTVDNDATCAMAGEAALGAARGMRDALMITLGTGIGGGLLLEGQIYRGAHGFAGEVGHFVIDVDGPACACGKRGCWEQLASGPALARMAREAIEEGKLQAVAALVGGDVSLVRGEHVTQAAAAGDGEARALLEELVHWMALGLEGLVEVLDVEAAVIGGGMAEAGELIMGPLRREVNELLHVGNERDELPVLKAELGSLAGAVGAAFLAWQDATQGG